MEGKDDIMEEERRYSYSQLKAYEQCPKMWAMNGKSKPNAFAQYGSFIHKLLAEYYISSKTREEIIDYYVKAYDLYVTELFTENVNPKLKYEEGLLFLKTFPDLAENKKVVDVEKKIFFQYVDRKFAGIVDLILQDENGNFIVIDHKTGTANGAEQQLSIYAEAIKKEYGKYPSKAIINSTKEYRQKEYKISANIRNKTENWARKILWEMENITEHEARPDWFFCNNLCDYRDICKEWQE